MFKYEVSTLVEVSRLIGAAGDSLMLGFHSGVISNSFTTSPALKSVVVQYSSYLSGHPGSLAVAVEAAVGNVAWLRDTMVPLIMVLEEQEKYTVDTFSGMILQSSAPKAGLHIGAPHRTEVPVLDLGYAPPVAAIELATPLKTLISMFSGDDSGIIAASESWSAASRRMAEASESLQRAGSLLGATAEGSAFSTAQSAMNDVAIQCSTVSVNTEMMAASMLKLPIVRSQALSQLVALEIEMAAEATAAGAATGGTGVAAVAAQEKARVAAWAAGSLQPALDTARPMVTNLAIPVVGHTGGGGLEAGGSATMAANETITQVAGGAAAPGASAPAAQPAAPVSQVSQVAATPASGTQAAPVSAAPTGPAGGGTPTAARGGPGASGFTGVQPASIGGTPVAPVRGASTASPVTGTVGQGRTGATGTVVQPLLPRSVSGGTPAMPMRGGMTPGFGTGVGSGGGTGVGGGTGATGGRPGGGMGMQGAAPVGSSASGGRPGGAGAPHMMGGAGMGAAGAGHKGKGAGHGRGAVSPFQSAGIGGGAKGSKGRSGLSGIQDYFRRQFLGEKPRTVKKVIR